VTGEATMKLAVRVRTSASRRRSISPRRRTMYRDMSMTYWLEKAEAEMRE
jgi:hypothetical protein